MSGAAAAIALWLASMVGAPATADELSRLAGHDVTVDASGVLDIRDIAGEGRPHVGVIEHDGDRLVLQTATDRMVLRGPLAIPRIAGPGYKVWVLGTLADGALDARRIGVLRKPE